MNRAIPYFRWSIGVKKVCDEISLGLREMKVNCLDRILLMAFVNNMNTCMIVKNMTDHSSDVEQRRSGLQRSRNVATRRYRESGLNSSGDRLTPFSDGEVTVVNSSRTP